MAKRTRNRMNDKRKVGNFAESLVVGFLGAATEVRRGCPAGVALQKWIGLLLDRARHRELRVSVA